MHDTHYYEKFMKRKLEFLKKMEISYEDIKVNLKSYFEQHPLTSLSKIEVFFDGISKQIERSSASSVRNFVTELDCLFRVLITNIKTQ